LNRIKGKRAIITGASSGIGRACAERLASSGVNLILVARRIDRLLELRNQLKRKYRVQIKIDKLDIRNRTAVKNWVNQLKMKRLFPDILINNAGLASGFNKIYEGDLRDWDKMIDTNVKGLLNVSRFILPWMVAENSGHVINIGSVAGIQVYPKGNVYNASKFAVRAITEGMQVDLLGTKIRVCEIDPAATRTEFSEVRFHGDKEEAAKVYEGFKPLNAEDIADAVDYVLNVPEHVNVFNLVVFPTAQRNMFLFHRE